MIQMKNERIIKHLDNNYRNYIVDLDGKMIITIKVFLHGKD